jgi:hypothetical protein
MKMETPHPKREGDERAVEVSTPLPFLNTLFGRRLPKEVVSVPGGIKTCDIVFNAALSLVKTTNGQVSTHNSHR